MKEDPMRRSIALTILAIVIAVPLLAGPPPDQILKATLDLDEQQLGELQQLMESRRIAVTDATRRMTELRGQLEAALNKPDPDPGAVGTLAIAIRAVERQVAQHQDNFRNSFFGILSDEQRQRVDSFKFIRAAFMGGTALDELGL
jgi:heavy-metal resistance protein